MGFRDIRHSSWDLSFRENTSSFLQGRPMAPRDQEVSTANGGGTKKEKFCEAGGALPVQKRAGKGGG